MTRQGEPDNYGLIMCLLFSLGAIFIGPLEAVVGLAAYWLLTDDDNETPVS